MRFITYMNGVRICPKCSGMLVKCGGEVRFRCMDCDARFEIVEMKSEKEFVLEDGKVEQQD